ncbi:LLM class oxidoreductase [Streptomyces calidiresistens]|uniref:TIGR03571 family LLM class oxidoreductase n=1 Tax=Streptomyces calidiresistens TaxID=1485586 RepID=A0A7W3T6Y3_9ACTN|nr:TIGR03571 family LLM class oxidoreductase [Streptomyces calidiresistens]MBB0232068.1 TIGR03571 family LLM class oxidoreductase [Streptomyces calidiresistens]
MSPDPGALHPGMVRAFPPDGMTLGLIAPLESFTGDVPTMEGHLETVRAAEDAGFASLWLRDVPLLVPGEGDGGQLFDPWVYLGVLTTTTRRITLGTAGVVLPLRHPLHVAKAAVSVDHLSGGRMLLGVVGGDRPGEMPAFGTAPGEIGPRLREGWEYLRHVTDGSTAGHHCSLGELAPGIGMVPVPPRGRLPMLMIGRGRQPLEWIAERADGWLYTALDPERQRANTARWRRATGEVGEPGFKPYGQAGYLVLDEDPVSPPRPMTQGWAMGREPLLELFAAYRAGGVNQLMVNLRHNVRPVREVLEELAEYLLPHFPAGEDRPAVAVTSLGG